MFKTVKTAFTYLLYYKKQTLALLLGVVISVGLLTGVSSLVYSGKVADMERCRSLYGDAHYILDMNEGNLSSWKEHKKEAGFAIERAGIYTMKKKIESPYNITFAYADQEYRDMFGRTIVSGTYPARPGEAALDKKALQNLEIDSRIGSRFELSGKEFTLCGITADKWDAKAGDIEVFVSQDIKLETEQPTLYVKFDESSPVYPQLAAFCRYFHYNMKETVWNSQLTSYVGGNRKESVFFIIGEGLHQPAGKAAYIWGTLNEVYNLTEKLAVLILGLFAAFVIFSLFQISLRKRMSQYGIMQVLGMDEKRNFALLISELYMILLAGYPLGAVLGNGAAGLFYSRMGEMFVNQDIGLVRGGLHQTDARELASSVSVEAGSFHVSWNAVVLGAIFLLILMLAVSVLLVRRMRKHTWAELITQGGDKKRRSRRVYSLKKANMTGILGRRFVLEQKGMFCAVIFSLALGGILFLGTTYVAQNTKIHNEMTFKADDGLGSDMQVYEDSHTLSDVIPEKTAERIKQTAGIRSASPVSYTLGEIPLENGSFTWKNFYPEVAEDANEDFRPDPLIMERYNGIITQQGDEDYRLKVNIYGYCDEMLEDLSEYVLEGSLSPEKLKQENTVVWQALMDGQGYYNDAVKVGDTIRLKVPANPDVPQQALRFEGSDGWYKEKSFKVAAVVSRPLGKTDEYINLNAGGSGITAAVIMTNRQMDDNFGIKGYNSVGITLEEGADSDAVHQKLRGETSGIAKCLITDYTRLIKKQNLYLQQKLFFFYGIAAILLIISIFHMMNSMRYLVAARRYEFGVLRAMGITDAGFGRILMRQGLLYGLCAAGLMLVLYWIVQKLLYYGLQHVFLYLHASSGLPPLPIAAAALLNILICIGTMLWAGREVLRDSIIQELTK